MERDLSGSLHQLMIRTVQGDGEKQEKATRTDSCSLTHSLNPRAHTNGGLLTPVDSSATTAEFKRKYKKGCTHTHKQTNLSKGKGKSSNSTAEKGKPVATSYL